MDSVTQKRIYFVVNAVLFSTFFASAQDYDFQKAIIKESMSPKMLLKPENTLPYKPFMEESSKEKKDPKKYINLRATYNYRLDSLIQASLLEDSFPKSKISPYLTAPYTNFELDKKEAYKFSYEDWEATSIVSELHKNSAARSSGSGVDFFSKENWRSTKRKKEALKRIKKAYNMKE